MSDDLERLREIFGALDASGRSTLLAFAEFLRTRAGPMTSPAAAVRSSAQERPESEPAAPVPVPVPIPRPEKETVVAAIKRLRRTYSMLDRNAMLNEVYTLMNQHVLEGGPAQEVIDELERVFEQCYRDRVADGA
ncbi:hypothetical protein BMS3Bbin12_01316 [bacterium BMS3Bbin12]|nr:hypothetical protein BMS3Bbin12_01316 [bacterium BMS3Bbin12]GBE50024.1 hypothetical protein BMS3Bbin13_00949 [bacterium BMS3Bbin13]HDJ86743.1 hypothetical protein [Chromatiales bacterium]HDO34557.1 hypothetical protein [Chromatiales bacterium]